MTNLDRIINLIDAEIQHDNSERDAWLEQAKKSVEAAQSQQPSLIDWLESQRNSEARKHDKALDSLMKSVEFLWH